MSETSCEELINIFNKIGGFLKCDFNKNTIEISNTNLKCKIKPTDYENIELLMFEFACSPPCQPKHLKTTNLDEIINSDIKLKNRYLKNDEYGFTINYICE